MSCNISGETWSAVMNELGLWLADGIGGSYFCSKKHFGKKFFAHNFDRKKCLVKKKFWSKKIFGPKTIFGPKKFLIKKKLLVKKNFRPEKIFGSEKIFGP